MFQRQLVYKIRKVQKNVVTTQVDIFFHHQHSSLRA